MGALAAGSRVLRWRVHGSPALPQSSACVCPYEKTESRYVASVNPVGHSSQLLSLTNHAKFQMCRKSEVPIE